MDRKTEHMIFFTALLTIGVLVVGGVSYFKVRGNSDPLLADVEATIQQTQNQNPNVETIPTSTIITTTSTPIVPISALTLPYAYGPATATSTYWPKAWGNISLTDQALALIPDPSYHGANSFLNGSASWTDYSVSADVSWLQGGWFDIVSRVSNNTQNFVYCEFGANGTEVIERVDGVDTQLAATVASTTDNVEGATENFGMKVYGDDAACLMNNQEVVGATVKNGEESRTGGIGFVIFGAPTDQKEVSITNISVTPLLSDTITAPFSYVPPSVVFTPIPNPPAPTSTPAQTPPASPSPTSTTPTSTPNPGPTSTPPVTNGPKTLPYYDNSFSASDGWNTYWGNFSIANDSLNIAASTDGTSGGVLLSGTEGWENYIFTATLDWVKGQTFGLYARYTNAQNYVVCVFSEPYLGDVQVSLEQHVNGNGYTLAQGNVTGFNQWGGSNIVASIEVHNEQGTCSFNNNPVSSYGTGFTLNPPFSGKIGFMTSDPSNNNAEIIVSGISVTQKY